MVSKIEPDRYADTGFSLADTPQEMNDFLFQQMMAKTGAERLIIGCRMADAARKLVWSGIPAGLPEKERRVHFLHRFYGQEILRNTLKTEYFKLKTSNFRSFPAEEKNACSIDAMLNGGICEAESTTQFHLIRKASVEEG